MYKLCYSFSVYLDKPAKCASYYLFSYHSLCVLIIPSSLQAMQHLAVHHELRIVSSSSTGLSETSSQPEGLMHGLSFCKEYTPSTIECPDLPEFLSLIKRHPSSLVNLTVSDDVESLTTEAGKAVVGYSLYQVNCL